MIQLLIYKHEIIFKVYFKVLKNQIIVTEWNIFIFLDFLFLLLTLLQVSPFTPFSPLHPASSPTSLWPPPHCCLCLWVMHGCSLAHPFTFFHLVPSPYSPLTFISLFNMSMPLFLFCSSHYFVHSIPHVSEIIWYLSFSDWLISFSIILFRPIHAVAKGKLSFFFTAAQYSIV